MNPSITINLEFVIIYLSICRDISADKNENKAVPRMIFFNIEGIFMGLKRVKTNNPSKKKEHKYSIKKTFLDLFKVVIMVSSLFDISIII